MDGPYVILHKNISSPWALESLCVAAFADKNSSLTLAHRQAMTGHRNSWWVQFMFALELQEEYLYITKGHGLNIHQWGIGKYSGRMP